MIRRLRRRFIRIALIALTVAMVLVTGVVNLVHWVSVRGELQDTLDFLVDMGGMDAPGKGGRLTGKPKHTRNVVSEASWFSVFLDARGQIRVMNLNSMTDADEDTAAALAQEALASGRETGWLSDYLYRMTDTGGARMLLFLNCETKRTAAVTLACISGAACLGGILLAWLIVSLASRRAIGPIIRNMEQQKQFITNASHELKTPLTVISTNMQLLQMEAPGSPWVASTQKQTAQMRRLVEELVYLSRLEEEGAPLAMEPLRLDSLLIDAAEPFRDMAEFAGKRLTVRADAPVTVTGDRASLERLLSTLLDNAVKYGAPEGEITAEVRQEGRQAVLTVTNPVTEPLTRDQLSQMFNRFYRADPSRSKDRQEGFGIGLAIAAAIAEKHGGTIEARMAGDTALAMVCRLNR